MSFISFSLFIFVVEMRLKFAKYQGAGNDFVLLDAREGLPVSLTIDVVAGLCDRRFGVGADGLMALELDPEGSDFRMRYFNCDGRESTMCGNGGRAIARFADDLGVGGRIKTFRAIDGLHRAQLNDDMSITLEMINIARVDRIGNDFFVESGSPHYVIIGEPYDIDRARQLRNRYDCNVNFVELLGEGRLSIRTFERGVEAETFACGTGATAGAVAVDLAMGEGLCGYRLQTLGGELCVEWERRGEGYVGVRLTGPACRVFRGELQI